MLTILHPCLRWGTAFIFKLPLSISPWPLSSEHHKARWPRGLLGASVVRREPHLLSPSPFFSVCIPTRILTTASGPAASASCSGSREASELCILRDFSPWTSCLIQLGSHIQWTPELKGRNQCFRSVPTPTSGHSEGWRVLSCVHLALFPFIVWFARPWVIHATSMATETRTSTTVLYSWRMPRVCNLPLISPCPFQEL